MKQFYSLTYYFWMVARAVLFLFVIVDFFRLVSIYGLSLQYVLSFAYSISLFAILYRELLKLAPLMILKYCVGVVSILIGIAVAYIKFSEPEPSWGLARYEFDYWKIVAYGFSALMVLLGLFDFYKLEKNPVE